MSIFAINSNFNLCASGVDSKQSRFLKEFDLFLPRKQNEEETSGAHLEDQDYNDFLGGKTMNWAPRSIQHLSIFWLCTDCPVKTGLVSAPLISSIALATARFSVSWSVRMRVGTQKCLQASIKFSGTVLLWLLLAYFKNTTTLEYLYPYVWISLTLPWNWI